MHACFSSKIISALGALSLLICVGTGPIAAQAAETAETLTLERAISRALAANRSIQQQRLALRLSQLNYDNAWDAMFMPGISLSFASNSNFTIGHVPGKLADAVGDTENSHGYPSSSATLALGSYTIFNFWRDWNVYEQAKLDWNRARETYTEFVRATRIQVVLTFFRCKTEQDKLEAAQRSVEISEAIAGLVKSRQRQGQANERDVSSSEVDVLNARNELNQRRTNAKSFFWTLNQLLGDPIDTQYVITEEIKFVPLRISPEQALRIYLEQSPSMKNAVRDLRKADLTVELEEKNRLPLPKISFSGVNVGYTNQYFGTRPDLYTNQAGTSNFDIIASVNLVLPLTGPGGLFNSRRVEQTHISRELTEINYRDISARDQATIFQLISSIRQDEMSISNGKKAFESSSALLDSLFSQLSNKSTSRLEIRDAIKQARDSEIALAEATLSHLSNKLTLVQLMGVDRLEGDAY
jgi:outer membrane protein TolC